MKVLIVDKFEAVDELSQLGFDVAYHPGEKGDALVESVRQSHADALVVRSTKVTEAILQAAERLTLIVRAGSGYDNIDLPAASKRGIYVATCPGKNAIAVSELAWGLILGADRRIPDN